MAYWGDPNSAGDRDELAFMLAEALAPMGRAAMARLPRWVDDEIYRHGLGNPADVVLMKLLGSAQGFDPQKGRLSAYVGRMMSNACADLQVSRAYVVAPVSSSWPLSDIAQVIGLLDVGRVLGIVEP